MDYNGHRLARGHKYSAGEIPLFALAEELALKLAATRPQTWSKVGANNDLREVIAASMSVVGIEADAWSVPGLLREFAALMRQGVFRPRHPHLGIPVVSPDDISLECYVSQAEADKVRSMLEIGDAPRSEVTPSRGPEASPANSPRDASKVRENQPAPWQDLARSHAQRIRNEREKRGWYPSLTDLAEEVAKVFTEEGVTGPNGHHLRSSYIKRHALQGHGITSDQGRLRAKVKRGK